MVLFPALTAVKQPSLGRDLLRTFLPGEYPVRFVNSERRAQDFEGRKSLGSGLAIR